MASVTHREVVAAVVEAFWEPKEGSTDREAFGGIMRAVGRLVGLLKRAPRALDALKAAMGLDQNASLVELVKSGDLVKRLKEMAVAGKKALGEALKKALSTFPLSLFFVPKNKAPGLTDLIARILKKSPRVAAFLARVKGGALKLDTWLKKHIPNLSRVLYAAIFIWVWLNVAELSWDIEGILAGFTGKISLGDLLASLPESGLGAIAASFGLGFHALPVTLIARIIWLVANHYVSYVPGKGLVVHWSKMDVPEPDEAVATA